MRSKANSRNKSHRSDIIINLLYIYIKHFYESSSCRIYKSSYKNIKSFIKVYKKRSKIKRNGEFFMIF